MKKILLITILCGCLSGCIDYVEPRDTHITVDETHASDLNARTERTEHTERVSETQTETETEPTTEIETETEVSVERETHAIWITEGVNIRAGADKSTDRLGGARFGEQFMAYIDTFGNEFIEVIYNEKSAYIWAGCVTTSYDIIITMKAEQERMRRQAETQPQSQTEAIIETDTDTQAQTEIETQAQTESETVSGAIYSAAYFKQAGVLNWGGSKWTWYTQRILPGESLWIPGRHLDESGYVCDENGYIVCAADLSYIPRYTVIETPLGKLGKIYDTGCVYGVIDVYTDW